MTDTEEARQVTRLRALAEKATPGPWYWEHRNESRAQGIFKVSKLRSRTAKNAVHPQYDRVLVSQESWYVHPDPADAAYIAALSPDVVTALLDVVDAARTLCDDEESGVDGFGPDITHITPLRAALDRLQSMPPAYQGGKK